MDKIEQPEEAKRREAEVVRQHSVVMSPRLGVYQEVEQRRHEQDAQHGGPDHDDTHSPDEWVGMIDFYNMRGGQVTAAQHRDAMLDVAALAIAAIEVIDRKAAVNG